MIRGPFKQEEFMKKMILFLGMILVLIATPLFSQDKGVQLSLIHI